MPLSVSLSMAVSASYASSKMFWKWCRTVYSVSVSYTHLDVYKRQGRRSAAKAVSGLCAVQGTVYELPEGGSIMKAIVNEGCIGCGLCALSLIHI